MFSKVFARYGAECSTLMVSAFILGMLAAGCAGGKTATKTAPALAVGVPITAEDVVPITDLASNPDRFVGRTVKIEGKVAAVCQGAGCWAEVAAADGTTFLAKSLDDSVLLPTDCEGRRIVVQGVVTRLGGETHTEPVAEGHVCPQPEYLLSMEAAELH